MLKGFEFLRRALKNDRSIIEGENPVRNEKNIRDLVADKDRSKTELFMILGNHAQDRIFADRVQPRGGFVKKDDLRIGDQGPRQCHSLLHTPGDLRGIFLRRFNELCLFDSGHDPAFDLCLAQVHRFANGGSDILIDRHRVEESIALKHVTHLA